MQKTFITMLINTENLSFLQTILAYLILIICGFGLIGWVVNVIRVLFGRDSWFQNDRFL